VAICLERDADLHMAQLMPLPLAVSCFNKIQIGFTFLVPADPGSPGKKAIKRVCVCVPIRRFRGRSLLCPAEGSIKRYRDPSVCLSVPWRSCLGYRHAGCLQLCHRRPPEMCVLRTRPRTDVDPPRYLPPSNCHWRGHIVSPPPGDTLISL